MKKKIVSLFLVATLLFSNALVANAGIKETEKAIATQKLNNAIEISDYDELVKELSDSVMTNKVKGFMLSKELSDHILEKDLLVDALSYQNENKYDLDKIVDAVYLEYVGHYNTWTGITRYQINALNTNYNQDLSIDYEDYYDSILSNINMKNLTTYEKIYYIHKYVCDSFDYDPAYENDNGTLFHNETPTLQTSVNSRKFICGNYAVMMKDLLNRAGVDCLVILGFSKKGVSHAWNLVKVGEKWYWLDTTWDDYNDTNLFLLNGSDTFLESHELAYVYKNNLSGYNISSTDYEGKLVRPYITGISISSKKILHVDYQMNGAKNCKIYVNKKVVKNNKKISFKNGSEIKIKFDDKNKTVFKYKVYKVGNAYKLMSTN